ncbi:MAG: beta-ribofuranosylaminobenzene 5'-phosphate synthase [Archaeoglobaceae archaeon]|nr:beta-ribofuranosylaminobenzene 5'-phosphate synthase [Archaeoglobaceae archaeon]MDW8128574.1 beta-ribofuranosylaminobenzene 5'-phosphate synthase [Archaeoglobaceae archaeon]
MRIRTPSRVHITLIDMNGSLGRIDGGVGFALNEPFIEIEAFESEEVFVKGKAHNLDRFLEFAKKLSNYFGKGIEIFIKSDYRSHIGLGSGTQIGLAIGKAFSELYDLNLTIREIAEIVGRGGTSGIGVAVFEFGGFVVDGGHSMKEKKDFLPSSASKAKPAKVISRLDFPDWDVFVLIPKLSGAYGSGEINLFQKSCPVPLEDVRELCHLILMKMLPAVAEADLDSFLFALRRIQHLGFKRAEVERYGKMMREFLDHFPAGMSSTGPSVFTISDTNLKTLAKDMRSYFEERGIECEEIITKGRNRGAEVEL